jgi:hypothetical protein
MTRFLSKIKLEHWVLIGAFLGILVFQALPGPRPLDDAYITYRYARSISQGQGFSYNPGEHVQGTTTPLYTLLLAGLASLLGATHLVGISFIIALLADMINTWLMFRLASRLLGSNLVGLLAAGVFMLQPLRLNIAGGGMETSFFILLLLCTYERQLIAHRPFQAAVFAALAILTRIDAVLAIAPVFVYVFLADRRTSMKAAGLAALLILPWFVWATVYFGSPIPFSLTAKLAAYQDADPRTTVTFMLFFLGTGTVGPYQSIWIIFPGLTTSLILGYLGVRHLLRSDRRALVMVVYPLLYFLVMSFQHAPLFFAWYYLPLMPGLLLLFFSGLLELARLARRYQSIARKVLLGGASMILVLFPGFLLALDPGWAAARTPEAAFGLACQQVQAQVQPGQVVFAPDIGVLGWCLEKARILDPIGIVSPISLNYMKQRAPGEFIAPVIILDEKPDFIIARAQFINAITARPDFSGLYRLIWEYAPPSNASDIYQVFERR